MKDQRVPHEVFRVGGREFSTYQEYDETLDQYHIVYPDFEENPEYTDEGRPFATAGQESCAQGKPRVPGDAAPEDCGGCGWFYREVSPFDIIGICTSDALQQSLIKKNDERITPGNKNDERKPPNNKNDQRKTQSKK